LNGRAVLAMRGSVNYGDVLLSPMSLVISILLISISTEVGRRGSLDNKGVSRDILIILLGFAIAFFIIGIIIPLTQG
jgi:hypothetical protein